MDMTNHFTNHLWLSKDPYRHLQFLMTHVYHIATVNKCAFQGSVSEDYPFPMNMKICSYDTHTEVEKTFVIKLDDDPNLQMVKIMLEMIGELNLDRPVIHPCCKQVSGYFPLFVEY